LKLLAERALERAGRKVLQRRELDRRERSLPPGRCFSVRVEVHIRRRLDRRRLLVPLEVLALVGPLARPEVRRQDRRLDLRVCDHRQPRIVRRHERRRTGVRARRNEAVAHRPRRRKPRRAVRGLEQRQPPEFLATVSLLTTASLGEFRADERALVAERDLTLGLVRRRRPRPTKAALERN
jgi:hypothetical protein